jgi:hypothetical protein
MKNNKARKNPSKKWTERQERERDNILHPELFSVPRHSHLLMTKERRTGEERSLVGKYLKLADIALSDPVEDGPSSQAKDRRDKKRDSAA